MDPHILFAYSLSGPERGHPIATDAEIAAALGAEAPAWLHLSASDPASDAWIDRHMAYLDAPVRDALTEPLTRPRAVRIGGGLLVNLRGINFNEGDDPGDMVSVRMWIDPHRIVSLSRRPLRSVRAVADRVASGQGPERSGDLLAQLVEELTDRIETQVADLEDRAERLEALVVADPRPELGSELSGLRLELIELRRFLSPQRDAVQAILRAGLDWIDGGDRQLIAEQHDQLSRVIETLDALRDQFQTMRDELEAARADRTNRNLYILSVISAVFLPLGFLTGLMGINLGGMPGAGWPFGFWVFSGLLAGVGILVLLLMRRLHLF
ncbi:zinc transporter ZntB [Mangrovicoccus sp. HB161399]|uniref:zinc transporter ZntB n=1 Tax=Mangrovicoccus sp. HB161399 TaxID=2720392 RepID=UPI001555D25C|nr:zinc transporter ZntB [Mangrovicoccus sp. HB161399]